jgi:hypothetical protein
LVSRKKRRGTKGTWKERKKGSAELLTHHAYWPNSTIKAYFPQTLGISFCGSEERELLFTERAQRTNSLRPGLLSLNKETKTCFWGSAVPVCYNQLECIHVSFSYNMFIASYVFVVVTWSSYLSVGMSSIPVEWGAM